MANPRWLSMAAVAACMMATGAEAQFTPRPASPTPRTRDDAATISWDWDFVLDRNEVSTGFGTPNWFLSPSSPPAAAGQTLKFVNITLQHLVRQARHDVLEPVPNTRVELGLQFGFRRVAPPLRTTSAVFVQQHGRQDHADVYEIAVTEPGADGRDGRVTLQAKHTVREIATWSFEPALRRAGAYIVTASYPSDPLERQDPPARDPREATEFGAGSGRQSGRLERSTTANPQSPTDWLLEVAYNPRSVTTLAYVTVTADGRFDKAELGRMTRYFLDDGTYLVPVLLDAQGADLHVAIDLTQWVPADAPFEQDEQIAVAEGVTDRLPGVLVSNSPVRFDGEAGFVTDDPFSGTVVVSGTIDGGTVRDQNRPRLLLLALIAIVLAVTAFFVLRTRRARTATARADGA